MRLLLDTNVLIDYFSRRQPYFESCIQLRAMQAFGEAELWASAKSFTDIFYVLRKKVDPRALQRAFVESGSFLNICSIGPEDIRAAALAQWDDFEDCLINQAAQRVKADVILTRDKEGFSTASISVKSPAEFFTELKNEKGIEYDITSLLVS